MGASRVLVLAVIAGCGGSGGGTNDGGDDAPSRFPEDFITVECEAAERCGWYETAAECRASVPLDREYAQAVEGVARGVVRFDAALADACLESRRDADCRSQGRVHDDPCRRVYAGLVADGAACQYDDECASHDCVATDPSCDEGCCPGTCGPTRAVVRDVPIGGTCSNDDNCVAAAFCDATSHCTAAIADEGAACEDALDCAEPMICDVNAAQPTCRRPAEPNATCDPDRAQPCIDQRDSCRDGTCQRALAPGATCAGFFDCVAWATCDGNTCVAKPAAGDACGPDLPLCAGLTACRDGVCTPPDPFPVCEL